jgi:hypothetical protein
MDIKKINLACDCGQPAIGITAGGTALCNECFGKALLRRLDCGHPVTIRLNDEYELTLTPQESHNGKHIISFIGMN